MTPNQRKSSPALYELVGNGRPPRTETNHVRPREVAPARVPESPVPAPQLEGEMTAGGSVRVPAGAIFLIVFGVFAALFVGYLIGYQQKAREFAREASQERVNGMELPRDPLNERPVNPELVDRETRPTPVNPTPEDDPEPIAGTPGGSDPGTSMPELDDPLTVIVENGVEDPRVPGLNYLAITSEGRERIEPFLAYLNANGVDAAAYPVNNGVYRVYALRGFSRDEYRNDRRPFESAMRRLTESFTDGEGRGVTYSPFWDKY